MNYVERVLRKEGAWSSLVKQSPSNVENIIRCITRRNRQRTVAEAINQCLTWSHTAEGRDYWSKLYEKYYYMSDIAFELLLKTQQIKYNKDLK